MSYMTSGAEAWSVGTPRSPTFERNLSKSSSYFVPASRQDQSQPQRSDHKVYVFVDLVAFRNLEVEPCVDVMERRRQLGGYEAYLVEQWACSRGASTYVIATYTGDPSHKISIGLLAIAKDKSKWTEPVHKYFDTLEKYHAREKETELGTIMVTNLSGFPSALNVIQIPEGDVRHYREAFMVNENLKRMGCSGRSALTLSPPSDATQAKFYHIYRTSDRIPFNNAVLELVQLCQVALYLFGMLEIGFADGLLCDMTEKAVIEWWYDIGPDYFDTEATDGILGPTKVSALLGIIVGARERLHSYGSPVPKDPFEAQTMRRGIAHFQKHQKLPQSRNLDRATLDRLHRATSKTGATGELFRVPNAIRTTVADLSGKTRISNEDVESCDIDLFIPNVKGERLKYLWKGKQKKTTQTAGSPERPKAQAESLPLPKAPGPGTLSRAPSYSGSSVQTNNPQKKPSIDMSDSKDLSVVVKSSTELLPQSESTSSAPKDSRDHLRKAMFRTMTSKNMDSARTTFGGKLKNVAGSITNYALPGSTDYKKHNGRARSGHDFTFEDGETHENGVVASRKGSITSLRSLKTTSHTANGSIDGSNDYPSKSKSEDNHSMEALSRQTTDFNGSTSFLSPSSTMVASPVHHEGLDASSLRPVPDFRPRYHQNDSGSTLKHDSFRSPSKDANYPGYASPSAYNLTDNEEDPNRVIQSEAFAKPHMSVLLRRQQSMKDMTQRSGRGRHEDWWPRRLSFGHAEEAVLDYGPSIVDEAEQSPNLVYEWVSTVEGGIGQWVETKVDDVKDLYRNVNENLEELSSLYHHHLDTFHTQEDESADLMQREIEQLSGTIKETDAMGARLQYELSALVNKIEDVEDSIKDFGRLLEETENKIDAYEKERFEGKGWWNWLVRVTLGIGDLATDGALDEQLLKVEKMQ